MIRSKHYDIQSNKTYARREVDVRLDGEWLVKMTCRWEDGDDGGRADALKELRSDMASARRKLDEFELVHEDVTE
jgi:hypothetical protein